MAARYTPPMVDDSGKLLVEGLDQDDLNLLRERGVDTSALVRSYLHERAEQIRAEKRSAYRRRLIREVAAERRTVGGDYTAEQVVADIHADRRAAGWE
jgi:hypothetical protein